MDTSQAISMKSKKVRANNFPQASVTILCELVEDNIEIIQSKQTNSVTNAKKAQVWAEITDKLNARADGQKRTVSQVREKWRKECSKAKLELNLSIKSKNKTGGGPSEYCLNENTQKIITLHSDAPNFVGIEGGMDIGVDLARLIPVVQSDNVNECNIYEIETTNPNNEEKGEISNVIDFNNTTTDALEVPTEVPREVHTCSTPKTQQGHKRMKRKLPETLSVKDHQIKCLKQENIKLKHEIEKLIEEKALIQSQKEKVLLEKELLNIKIKKMKIDES